MLENLVEARTAVIERAIPQIPEGLRPAFASLRQYHLSAALWQLMKENKEGMAELVHTNQLPGETAIFKGVELPEYKPPKMPENWWTLSIEQAAACVARTHNPAIMVGRFEDLKSIPKAYIEGFICLLSGGQSYTGRSCVIPQYEIVREFHRRLMQCRSSK